MSFKNNEDRSPNTNPLHFLLVPLLAQGHLIPMVDLARLLAARGNLVTFATTPINLSRIHPIVNRSAAASTVQIRFIELRFCVADVGLPDNCENIDLLPSMDLLFPFLNSLHLLRAPLEAYLKAPDPLHWPPPACLISDNIQNWTIDFARSLGIPRLIFQGPSCFYLLCDLLINRHVVELESAMAAASGGPIILPGITEPVIRINKHKLMLSLRADPGWFKFIETMKEIEDTSQGIVINSFVELESWYIERYHEEIGKPIWPVGPLSLYNEDVVDDDAKLVRGRVSSIDNKFLLQWLDRKEPDSVVLVSFGSIAHNTMEQIEEIGEGLEASTWPFVWVVKEAAEGPWMAAYEKRVAMMEKGIVIKGWAPQTILLNHVAVGGFVTHCGWNSTVEAIAAGVVMATWPHFGDQFFNERLVVEELKIGVAVGVEKPTVFGVENDDEVVVKVRRGEVEKVVEMLMEGGDEGKERRERARELKKKARMAMEKEGSSWKGLEDVINFVLECQNNKK